MPTLLTALLCAASPAAAQRRDGVAGRWRLEVHDLLPQEVRGELRLAADGGTLALSTQSGEPLPLARVRRLPGDSVEFETGAPLDLRFAGRAAGQLLRGAVTGPDGASGHWQADPLPEAVEYYAVLPRFTRQQVIAGPAAPTVRVPGAIVAAVRAAAPQRLLDDAAASAASAAGLASVPAGRLAQRGARRVLGLEDRDSVLAAVRRGLAAVRSALPSDSLRRRFDQLFRPRGEWVVDLHEAALLRLRLRVPSASWASLVPALQSGGWLAGGATAADVPEAAYRFLLQRAAADAPAGAVALPPGLPPAARGAATTLELMLQAYEEAEAWHRTALAFLEDAPWVRTAEGPRSPADLLRASWRAARPGAAPLPRPPIGTRRFGDPQAVPRYGVPAELVPRLVTADNWSAGAWLARHGPAALVAAVHTLDDAPPAATEVQRGGERLRLSSVPRESRARLNGFLEPRDAMLVDPGYVPLLAVGAVLHEWIHLLVARERLADAAGARGTTLELPAPDPFLAEGLAEYWTDRLLGPIAATAPVAAVAEAEKRARLAATAPDDPHVVGYLALRLAADGEASPESLLGRLVDAASLAAHAPRGDGPDLVVPAPGRRVLVPQATFTIEDGVADAVELLIRAD